MFDFPKRFIKLPQLLDRKLYKTGQTRGADDDVIYQNRVLRNNTALFPYSVWDVICAPQDYPEKFENGFIILIPPSIYFNTKNITRMLNEKEIFLGKNALLFYETREDWQIYNPDRYNYAPANNRYPNLSGQYVARIPATTSQNNNSKINKGFTSTSMKGAGIRGYEYATSETIRLCRLQLESIYWLCQDSESVARQAGMAADDVVARKKKCFELANKNNLLDVTRLKEKRILDIHQNTICPLCLERLSAQGFYNRLAQASGREIPDLTVTEINLFHIDELKYGEYNHKPYNLGWGHHHCNVVTKDSGINSTLEWMKKVLQRNGVTIKAD